MADVAQLLQTLHPMREPPPPAPVAPFLLMLAIGVAVAAIAYAAWRQARRRRSGLRRSAELALAATRTLDPGERLAAQARLLRRLVRARDGEAAARAHGDGWLAALDRSFGTTFFTAGAGRAYAEDLYRREWEGRNADRVEALDRSLADLFTHLAARTRAKADA